jgi:hypothetical protein
MRPAWADSIEGLFPVSALTYAHPFLVPASP